MKKAIVTTTINPPTEALKKFAEIAMKDNWLMIIVGDKKTPHEDYREFEQNYECAVYLDPKDQEEISQELSDLIGWNCIQRRNFGLLSAWERGCEIIATIDDDNIPYDGWGRNCLVNQNADVHFMNCENDVFDPLAIHLPQYWHRGYPVQQLMERKLKSKSTKNIKVLVQADLWDGDPDVDAICRITLAPLVKFNPAIQPYSADKPMPFNSQNTFLSRDIFPEYFLFPHIGRMDDIWGAYVMQQHYPESVIFSKASVLQERNEHDLVKDLDAELIGYRHTKDIIHIKDEWKKFVPEETIKAYEVWKGLFK